MKIAISGKGGVGKTTFAALLIRAMNAKGKNVLAIDADPDANLAAAIGIQNADQIVPITDMKDLIYERTGAKSGSIGSFFRMNPRVDDLPDALSVKFENIKFMRLGTIKKGGMGCFCPESTLLKSLITHIIVQRNEIVIMDMEAGIEHLGRGTAKSVDQLIIVVEPGLRSIETAHQIKKLAQELYLPHISVVGNKTRKNQDETFLKEHLSDFDILGFLPFDTHLIDADLNGQSPFDYYPLVNEFIIPISDKILNHKGG